MRDICGRKPWPEQTEVIYLGISDFEPFTFQSGRIMARFHSVGMTQYFQMSAPRPNWDAARPVISKEKKMEVDWPRKQNATDIYSKNSHALDPRRKQEEGTTKREAEKVCGARNEGSQVELGPGRKAGSGQNTMAFLGVGLMCEHVRRGLSK